MSIKSYSTTPIDNSTATDIDWAEGQPPSSVNNSARQMMADTRERWNDAQWFEFLDGTPDGTITYVANNQFKVTGVDVSSFYHIGRKVRIVGSSTGTIYQSITAVSFSTGDTTVTIDGTGLINEALAVASSIITSVNNPIPENLTIDGGTVDNSVIGGVTPAAASVTTLNASGISDLSAAGAYFGTAAAANLLNDYEEGSFTPTIETSAGSGTILYTSQSGKYTKVGNLVTCRFNIFTSSLALRTGNVSIGGLPFTSDASQNGSLNLGRALNLAIGAGQAVTGRVTVSATTCGLFLWDSAGGTTELQDTEWTNNGRIWATITYET